MLGRDRVEKTTWEDGGKGGRLTRTGCSSQVATPDRQTDRGKRLWVGGDVRGMLRGASPRWNGMGGDATMGLEPGRAPGMWHGCPWPRGEPPSSCGASPAGSGSSGSVKREKWSLRYLGRELE